MKFLLRKSFSVGQGIAEYILILGLIAAGVALSLELTGYSLRDAYCDVAASFGNESACDNAEVYCQDDFTNMDGWSSQYGKWTNPDGKMCTSRGAKSYSTCSESMKNNSDYTIKLDGAQLDRGNGYGVFFRGTELDGRTDGYIVQYDPGWRGGAIIMRKWVNGRELPPFAVQRMPGYDWHGEPHDLQLDVQGDTFILFLDGEKTLVGQDDTYTEGGVGFRSWDGSEVCFDGISVGQLSSANGGE